LITLFGAVKNIECAALGCEWRFAPLSNEMIKNTALQKLTTTSLLLRCPQRKVWQQLNDPSFSNTIPIRFSWRIQIPTHSDTLVNFGGSISLPLSNWSQFCASCFKGLRQICPQVAGPVAWHHAPHAHNSHR